MKKNIFYWAFLVLAGISLTACSSGDDNIADNTTPVTPDSQNKTVILTGTIGVGGDETRAVDNDGKTSWAKDDEIAINYQTGTDTYARVKGTITNVSSDGKYATFTATLTDAKNDGNIGFAYPFAQVDAKDTPENATDFEFDYAPYYTEQDGTTETITSLGLDYARTEVGGEVKMAVDNNKATLKSTAKLKNQFSMFEFTLVKEGETTTNVPATELQIWVGESTFSSTPKYTITPANSDAYSTFYVALEPTADNTTIDKVKIVASFNNQDAAKKLDADGVTAMTTDDVKHFICVDESEGTNQYQAYIYPSLTTPKVCEHTYGESKFVKGKLYSKKLTVKDLTARAVVAHVGAVSGYWSKFIALALDDAASSTSVTTGQTSAEEWASNHSVRISTSDPSDDEVYDDVAARGSNQPYDRVYDNVLNEYGYTSKGTNYANWINSATSGSALPGWRVPTVTDWRYIFASLCNGRSAIYPVGVGDYNADYPDLTSGAQSNLNYDQYGTAMQTAINNACGNSNLQGVYYWSGSQLHDEQEAAVNNATEEAQRGPRVWRYDFHNGYFGWYTATDNSRIRLVFAY